MKKEEEERQKMEQHMRSARLREKAGLPAERFVIFLWASTFGYLSKPF